MRADAFEPHRKRLLGVAYRMLGSVASAEDIVQETWLRWTAAADVDHPAAWLSTVCTRLCLDEVRSARVRREEYVGPWLPEPWVEAIPEPGLEGESVGVAFMLLLQQLNATQRAAWLLREVFDESYAHIATVIGTSEANCRQLVRRARSAIDARRPRFRADPARHAEVVGAFQLAVQTGDRDALEALLAEDVRFVGDGGGKAATALRPVSGADKVARMFLGLSRKVPAGGVVVPAWVNGVAGAVLLVDGVARAVFAFGVADGRIEVIHNMANPDKLGHVARWLTRPGPPG